MAISLQAVLSNGFAFCLMWNVLENGYLEPHANTRIDFHRERGKVRRVADVVGLPSLFKDFVTSSISNAYRQSMFYRI